MTSAEDEELQQRNIADASATVPMELGFIFRFLVVGVLNTVVGLGTIYSCKYFFSLDDIAANILGYTVGLTNSFFWNRRWTFAHTGNISGATGRFVGVFLVAYLANLGFFLLLKRSGMIDSYTAHAVATIPYTIIFYLGSRYYVFRKR